MHQTEHMEDTDSPPPSAHDAHASLGELRARLHAIVDGDAIDKKVAVSILNIFHEFDVIRLTESYLKDARITKLTDELAYHKNYTSLTCSQHRSNALPETPRPEKTSSRLWGR